MSIFQNRQCSVSNPFIEKQNKNKIVVHVCQLWIFQCRHFYVIIMIVKTIKCSKTVCVQCRKSMIPSQGQVALSDWQGIIVMHLFTFAIGRSLNTNWIACGWARLKVWIASSVAVFVKEESTYKTKRALNLLKHHRPYTKIITKMLKEGLLPEF